jgi:hypothetical protein
MSENLSRSALRVQQALEAAGIESQVVELPQTTRSAQEAAAAIGGVPPLGHETALETIVDAGLLRYDVVWAAAGAPNAVFRASPRQLAAGASVLPVAVNADTPDH